MKTEKEIEKLADALRKIAEGTEPYGAGEAFSFVDTAKKIANEALIEYKAALQDKVSDISSDKFYKLFKDELLVKCDRLLRDKGMSSAESNGCIGQAFDDTMEEYAAIVNERKDSTQLHQDF